MDDAERWAEAQRRAAAFNGPAPRRANWRALLPLLLSSLTVGIVSAVVRALLFPEHPEPATGAADTSGPPSAWFWVGLTIAAVGLLLSVVVLVRALVTRRLVIVSNRIDAPLSRRQRRRIGRIFRGRDDLDETELPVVHGIAEQRVRTFRALVPVYVCLGVFTIGTAVTFADVDIALPLLFGGLGAFAALALAIDTATQIRPAHHFLKLHP